ncbi:MAG: site-2 protease family protein, partial [Phycisphaerales bacterium]|nr:site-2 protease family protein [Phycisphaerales bacterium]
MFDIPGPLGTLFNFIVIAIGFGSIIFVHELGHFIAAKWAGIRVLAFSIGFGQVACSYRKGMGFQAGSSEPKYMQLVREQNGDHTKLDISPTEYRLSWLPLGGYVKMLGQEDLNPTAVSSAPDSYQNCSIPKRLVVISAGVLVNLITAALLFIVVFSVGLKIMPPTIGQVAASSPAAQATPLDSQHSIGLQPGDTVLSVNGKQIRAYRDIATEAAMSSPSKPARIVVERQGVSTPIEYEADLKPGAQLGLLDLGVAPLRSATLLPTDDLDLWNTATDNFGLSEIPPGSTITSINDEAVETTLDIQRIASTTPVMLVAYTDPDGNESTITVNAQQDLTTESIEIEGTSVEIDHILGLTGLMRVHPDVLASETKQGLMPGDIFVEIAGVAYPSLDAGIRTIRENSGKPIDIRVLRSDRVVDLKVQVSDEGRVGFYPDTTTFELPILTRSPSVDERWESGIPNGARLISVAGELIGSLDQLVPMALEFVDNANEQLTPQGFSIIPVTYTLSASPDSEPTEGVIELRNVQVAQLRTLDNRWPGGADMSTLFTPVELIDRSDGPIAAVKRGIHESRRVMLQTYLTFLRLTQGTVKVEHLKGPVGIAHIGTMLADEGFIKVLFFMALISINLAVINFLPLPIVDGG